MEMYDKNACTFGANRRFTQSGMRCVVIQLWVSFLLALTSVSDIFLANVQYVSNLHKAVFQAKF